MQGWESGREPEPVGPRHYSIVACLSGGVSGGCWRERLSFADEVGDGGAVEEGRIRSLVRQGDGRGPVGWMCSGVL